MSHTTAAKGHPVFAGLLIAVLLGLTPPAMADATHPSLTFSQSLSPEVELLPRLSQPGPVAQRINARLAELDASAIAEETYCRAQPRGDYYRFLRTTYNGPDFLSFAISTDAYCGGPHPDNYQEHVTFDLSTGAEIDLGTLLPRSLILPDRRETTDDRAAQAVLNRLLKLYFDHANQGTIDYCFATVVGDTYSFAFWPERESRSLMMKPLGLAYANKACADQVALPLATLRELHADPRLIEALAAG